MKVYLAGKISKHDWRHGVVRDLRNADTYDFDDKGWYSDNGWPILKNAIADGIHYTGPIPTACDHGCYHGENSHGMGVNQEYDCYGNERGISEKRAEVFLKCWHAIGQSDVFIAWIDTNDCYGTLVEIGMARTQGKFVAVGGNKIFDDMWFAYHASDRVLIGEGYEPAEHVWDTINHVRRKFFIK